MVSASPPPCLLPWVLVVNAGSSFPSQLMAIFVVVVFVVGTDIYDDYCRKDVTQSSTVSFAVYVL
jgi:hypothetical protein